MIFKVLWVLCWFCSTFCEFTLPNFRVKWTGQSSQWQLSCMQDKGKAFEKHPCLLNYRSKDTKSKQQFKFCSQLREAPPPYLYVTHYLATSCAWFRYFDNFDSWIRDRGLRRATWFAKKLVVISWNGLFKNVVAPRSPPKMPFPTLWGV